MSRASLIMITLLLTMLFGLVLQNAQLRSGWALYEVRVEAVTIDGVQPQVELSDASYRLIYHCRMMVVESLIIAKLTVNTMFDTAIDSIN